MSASTLDNFHVAVGKMVRGLVDLTRAREATDAAALTGGSRQDWQTGDNWVIDGPHFDCIQVFSGAGYDPVTELTVEGNIFIGVMNGFQVEDNSAVGHGTGWVLRNNVMAIGLENKYNDPGGNGGGCFSVNDTSGTFEIYNNTFYNKGGRAIFADCNDVVFKNNFFYDCGGDTDPFSGTTTGTLDYNGFDASGWTADANKVTGDPLFTDAGSAAGILAGGLIMQAGGAGVGAGLDLTATGFAADLRGVPRGAGWDLGAYQRSGAAAFRGKTRDANSRGCCRNNL